MCTQCFGVADLVSPTIQESLAPRRFCYTFRITGSAFLTVSFITDYREPYLNQYIQKTHFDSKSPYFSTSCIDIDAGTEVKVCLGFCVLLKKLQIYHDFTIYRPQDMNLEYDILDLSIPVTRVLVYKVFRISIHMVSSP